VPGRYLPAWQVMAGQVPRELLEGHLVLVGSSAQGLMDLRFNALGRVMPGVEAHAQALEQILTEHYLLRPTWARGFEALLVVVGGLVMGFLTLKAGALPGAAAGAIINAAILGGGWYAFVEEGLLIDTATPAIIFTLTFILCSVFRHFASEREQRWIKEAFARYVSPNRVSYLVDHHDALEIGGHRQECSFIFTDLASFTSLMEKIDPGEAVALLNAYLDEMIAIAFRHEGTLDRIVGDAVAIMFSAPLPQADHRARALACALEMDTFADRYSRDLQAKGIAFGKTRIGVHGGEVIVGNFGGSNIFDYRALGDPVNTAARLESVNKHLGTRICVSEEILRDCPDVVVRPVGRLVLKGKTKSLGVFEPVVEDAVVARAPLEAYRAAYAAMAAEQPDAQALFAALAADYPADPLVVLHLGRLQSGASGDLIVMSEK
jgi:adenylate cyclase